MTLVFSKHESIDCEVMGSVTLYDNKYLCLFSEQTKEIYIYKYKLAKKHIKLYPITNEDEFEEVCNLLDSRLK